MAPVKAPTPDQIKNWLHIKRVKPEKGKFKNRSENPLGAHNHA